MVNATMRTVHSSLKEARMWSPTLRRSVVDSNSSHASMSVTQKPFLPASQETTKRYAMSGSCESLLTQSAENKVLNRRNENLTLSSTEVGRFSGHSRRLHGSHTTRVLGAVNRAPVSHSSFLLGARSAELFSTRRFTSPSAGTVSSSDTLTETLSTITFNPERRMKVSRTQFISMNKFRSFLARIW